MSFCVSLCSRKHKISENTDSHLPSNYINKYKRNKPKGHGEHTVYDKFMYTSMDKNVNLDSI